MSRGRLINYQKSIRQFLLLFVLFLAIHAATFLFMPFAAKTMVETTSKKALIIVGLVFWVSEILGYLLLFLADSYRRAFVKRRLDGDYSMGCRMGIISFFKTIPGAIADGLFAISFLGIIVVALKGNINGFFTYVLLALLSFSFNMHGVFNGRIYKVATYKRKVRRDKK